MGCVMSNFNFDKLKMTEHMFKWLADKPYGFIVESVTDMLDQQVKGSILQSFTVTSEPEWLTGLLAIEGEVENKKVTRAGCAFEIAMYVQAIDKLHHLTGVYTWVVVHLDEPAKVKQRVWLDLDKTLPEIGSQGELQERIYFE